MSESFAGLDPAVRIAPAGPRGMVTLRGDPEALGTAVAEATGFALPAPRRAVLAGAGGVLWMSPDELMLLVPPGTGAAVAVRLAAALADVHHLAVDVSDARALFRLEGPGAREVLAKGAPVDLAPAAFGPGDLRRTRLGQVAVAFWMPAPEVFELMCFRSVGDFVAAWLANAARPGSLPGHLRAER